MLSITQTNAAVTLNCEYLVEQFSYETGLTTAQMAMPASFGPTYDFSPNGPWIMFPGDTARPCVRNSSGRECGCVDATHESTQAMTLWRIARWRASRNRVEVISSRVPFDDVRSAEASRKYRTLRLIASISIP